MSKVDAITIERARRGEREAMAAVLTSLQDVWFRFCLSQLRDVDLARDATQETALRVLKQLPGFRGQSKIHTWSLGIALNVIREQRRSVRRAELQRLPDGVDVCAADQAEDRPGEDELSVLRSMLGELPERQREALVLRFFEELSVEETAEVMNCAPGTIKATVYQALRSLRRRITRTGDAAADRRDTTV
jgi:RNA polymerase sigma-70 factor (ECF subfamily)